MQAIFPLMFAFAQQGAVVEKQIDASATAATVLSETRQAREAIAAGDKAASARHVDEGLRLSDELRKALEAAGKPLQVPITVDVETTSLYGPVKRGKDDNLTARRMKRETSVRQVTGETTSVTLDMGMAHDQLKAARAALADGNLSDADTRLLALENGVERRTVNAGLPLLKVRENLELARARVQDAKYKDAAAPLRAAAEALADYRTLSPGPRSDEAGILRQEIAAYADRIGRDHSDALLLIDRWRDTVAKWYPPAEPK